MVKNTQDRRARRSRKLLKESLLALMKEKTFSEISVRDVTDGADMNRGTFYLHYSGTAELLQSLESDLLAELQALVDANIQQTLNDRTIRPVLAPVLTFAAQRRDEWEVLLTGNAASGFIQSLQQLIRRNGTPLLEVWFHPQDPAQADYLLNFLTWGFVGLLREWFLQDMALSQEELLSAACRLADASVESFFSKP